MSPISELLNTVTTVEMTKKCQNPYLWILLKKELASKLLVQPYCSKKEVTVTTDASENDICRVLSQKKHSVIYLSKRLSATESRYSNFERETLAIVNFIGRLRQFLLRRNFKLYTDHKPLKFIFSPSKEILKTASARNCRWAISLILPTMMSFMRMSESSTCRCHELSPLSN